MLPSKFIPFLGRKGQELCCSFRLLLGIHFCMRFSKKARTQQQLVWNLTTSACPRVWETKEKAEGNWFCSPKAHPDTERNPGLVSSVQVFSLYQQEDTDGVYLSADVFKCQKHEEETHWLLSSWQCSIFLNTEVAMPETTLPSTGRGEIL